MPTAVRRETRARALDDARVSRYAQCGSSTTAKGAARCCGAREAGSRQVRGYLPRVAVRRSLARMQALARASSRDVHAGLLSMSLVTRLSAAGAVAAARLRVVIARYAGRVKVQRAQREVEAC